MQTLLQAGTAVLINKMSFLIVIRKHATYFAVTEILVHLIICPRPMSIPFITSSTYIYIFMWTAGAPIITACPPDHIPVWLSVSVRQPVDIYIEQIICETTIRKVSNSPLAAINSEKQNTRNVAHPIVLLNLKHLGKRKPTNKEWHMHTFQSFSISQLLVPSKVLNYPWCGYTNLLISQVFQATDSKGNMCSCAVEYLSCQLWTIIRSVCLEHGR